MLKKLRIKFIAMLMVSVTLVLTIAFTAICAAEYQRSNANLAAALEQVVNQAGEAMINAKSAYNDKRASESIDKPDNSQGGSSESAKTNDDSNTSPQDDTAAGDEDDQTAENTARRENPQIGGPNRDRESQYPVAVYIFGGDGQFICIDESTTASIDDSVLDTARNSLLTAADGYGTAAGTGLHYFKRDVAGTVIVAFADAANTEGWKSLAITLGLVGVATLAAFFLLSLAFSKWALRPVEQTWNSQRQFVTDASHELKTPLTVILANTSILLSHPERTIASESKWLESTQTEAKRMEGLVSEMLTLAQVESKPTLAKERVNFSDIVAGQALQFESVAFETGFQLNENITENLFVMGDEEHLTKLASTLIENASKYVNPAGSVSVMLSQSGKNAQFEVSNTGQIIAADDLPHIFDRFYRTDKARSSDAGGFGLGLAIARETARTHGGDIVAKSDEHTGTTFTVTLPLA